MPSGRDLDDRVQSGSESGKGVVSGRVGLRFRHDLAAAVEQLDRHAGQHLARALGDEAVAIRIGQVHAAVERRRQNFAEIVFHTARAAAQENVLDVVARVDGRAARHARDGSRRIESVQVGGRLLDLDDAIRPRRQVRGFVESLCVGAENDRLLRRQRIDRDHPHGHAGQTLFSRVANAVVVGVGIDVPAQRTGIDDLLGAQEPSGRAVTFPVDVVDRQIESAGAAARRHNGSRRASCRRRLGSEGLRTTRPVPSPGTPRPT